MAKAITAAATHMKAARMGATSVPFSAFKGNIVGRTWPTTARPPAIPATSATTRSRSSASDDVSGSTPKPLATWMNWGQHPSPSTATTSSRPTTSARSNGSSSRPPARRWCSRRPTSAAPKARTSAATRVPAGRDGAGVGHVGYAQMERGARLLADAVIDGWRQIGAGHGSVPFTKDFPVRAYTRWTPGPVSHPYPSISNCRTPTTFDGNPGAPYAGAPTASGPMPAAPTSRSTRGSGTRASRCPTLRRPVAGDRRGERQAQVAGVPPR